MRPSCEQILGNKHIVLYISRKLAKASNNPSNNPKPEVQPVPRRPEPPESNKPQVEAKNPLEMQKVHYGNTIKIKELPPEIDFFKPRVPQQEAKDNKGADEKLEVPSIYELPKEIENLIRPKEKEAFDELPPKEQAKEIRPIVQKEVKPRVVKDKSILNYGKIRGAKKQSHLGHHDDHAHHDHHNPRGREKRKLKQIDISYHENSYSSLLPLVLANYRFKNMQKVEAHSKDDSDLPKKGEELNGEGKKRFDNNDEYEGEWKEGKMHGKGACRFANGDRYEGDYHEGLMHGKGKQRA